jgi:hypothetical protein
MNNPDPEDQFQHISPFAYCANNPVSHIDPEGRFLHIAIGAVLGGAINYGGNNDFWNLVPVLRETHVREFNEFWRQFGNL